jgi:predicted acylesterase/phospholipase RssA
MDLCLGLYQEMLAEALNDSLMGLIRTVRPSCVCHDFDPATIFTAESAPGMPFPDPLPPEVMLVHRGRDITANLVHADAQRIEFRLPRDSHSGFVYLRTLSPASRQRRQDLLRICGDLFPPIPDDALAMHSPQALITIVYPPVIDSVRAQGISTRDQAPDKGIYTVEAEACRPVEICWSARLSDQRASAPLPACASISVTVEDDAGRKVTTGGATGCFTAQEAQGRDYVFRAISRARTATCGRSPAVRLRVQRFATLRLRLEPPGTTEIAEGGRGHLVVSCSCPAPDGGLAVQLAPSRAAALDLPTSVAVPEGQTEVSVLFTVLANPPRTVTVTASAARHRSATLTIQIIRPRAIVLSGGGAKGSFQVGAVAYFRRERWDEVEPDIVVGTSVGSINALGIAEGPAPADGSLDGIQRMERVWLGLRQNSSMYTDSVQFARLKELIADLKDIPGYAKPETIVPGVLLGGAGGFFGATTGGLLGLIAGAATELADDLPEIIDLITIRMKSLYSLAPTRALVLSSVRFDRIAASGKTLRLATVCLEDGLVYHVTESGSLISDIGRDPSFTGMLAGPLATRLTNGAMASAGIPVIFPYRSEAVTVDGTTRFMTLVDGGVREVLPIRTASDLGARFIIAIAAGPNRVLPYRSALNGDTITQFRNEGIVDIGLRAVELSTREVAQNEYSPDGGFCDGVDRVFVIPSFEVHGTQEVDPGLILINMAYGYMRAFEMYARFRQTVNTFQLFLLIALSDQITALRKQIWELEEDVLMLTDEVNGPRSVPDIPPDEVPTYPPAARFFEGPLLREIRRLKQEVFDLVVARLTTYGAESLPKRFDDPTIAYLNPITDWWDTWERHKEPLESLLRGFSLWSPLPIRVRIVVRNELGVPEQVFETMVPPPPVLTPGQALQLS